MDKGFPAHRGLEALWMTDMAHALIDIVATHPVAALACLAVVLLYVNLMAGPRVR